MMRRLSLGEWAALGGVLGLLLWQLGSFPAWWDSVVGFALFPPVNHYLDGQPAQWGWRWEDMYQHNAGLSPLYSPLVGLGLRAFGLELLAARLPVALFNLLALGCLVVAWRPWVSAQAGRTWLLLFGSSAWYLVFARSGGIVGFSLGLVFFVVAGLLALAAQARRAAEWTTGALVVSGAAVGGLVAALPYGHSSTRLLPLALAVGVPLARSLFTPAQRGAFLATLLLATAPQWGDWEMARFNYFNARGETIAMAMRENTDGTPAAMAAWAAAKVGANAREMLGFYLGTKVPEEGFWPTLVVSHWKTETVLYPRWAVPLFVLGFALLVGRAWRGDGGSRLLLLYGAVTALPGFLTGVGEPNASRLLLHAPAVYATVALGALWLLERVPSARGRTAASALFLATVAGLQAYSFFGYERGWVDDAERDRRLAEETRAVWEAHPAALVVAQEYPDFDLESYVMLRWRGGAWLVEAQRSGRLLLLKADNLAQVRAAVASGREVWVLTRAPADLAKKFPELSWRIDRQVDDVTVLQPVR